VLTIAGEKKNPNPQKPQNYHVMERSYGRFQRVLQLPFAPNPEQVRANFDHGVLMIRVPKQAQQQRSRRIEVRGGEPAQGQTGQASSQQASLGQPGRSGGAQASAAGQQPDHAAGAGSAPLNQAPAGLDRASGGGA
jgi:HSP20 family protein